MDVPFKHWATGITEVHPAAILTANAFQGRIKSLGMLGWIMIGLVFVYILMTDA